MKARFALGALSVALIVLVGGLLFNEIGRVQDRSWFPDALEMTTFMHAGTTDEYEWVETGDGMFGAVTASLGKQEHLVHVWPSPVGAPARPIGMVRVFVSGFQRVVIVNGDFFGATTLESITALEPVPNALRHQPRRCYRFGNLFLFSDPLFSGVHVGAPWLLVKERRRFSEPW